MEKLKENSETNVENSENKEAINKLHKALKIPFVICMFLYITSLFTVFFTPIDILDTNKNCADFVNFMEQIFSNIKIFGSVSKIPQVIKFHASVVWVFAMILCAIILLHTILVQYKKLLNLEQNSEYKLLPFWTAFMGILFWFWGMWIYASSHIVTHTFDYGIRVIKITMSGKFEIFFCVGIFQSVFIGSFWGFLFSIINVYINWKKMK